MSEWTPRQHAILEAALKLPPEDRHAYLDQACAGDEQLRQHIEALLQAQGQGGDNTGESTVPAPSATIALSFPTLAIPLGYKPGDKIGRYTLLKEIAEGGMGAVYVAEQEQPIRRRVALKVIKLGMDTKEIITRFEAERQALALMDHPNIAKVFDAGATDTGRPYFVMELVDGIPITRFCDEHNLNTRERLKLFGEVCHAIQHAHQKGIIHRDIKPSNILVSLQENAPVPKVIDFGIAKATDQRLTDKTLFTALDQFIGTPAYMSPEQAGLSGFDIDTRSDIYSLGVLLYELLTGKTPFDPKRLIAAGVEEIRRIIREEEPPRPSTRLGTSTVEERTTTAKRRHTDPPKLVHQVRGDLDWIVMKCLEKDRTRRYETANGLAADLLRHLNNEPVVARPPSQMYRLQKLVRRNKLAFAAAAAVIVALVAGVTVALLFYKGRAEAYERARAAELKQSGLRAEAEKAREEKIAAGKREQEKSRQLAGTLSQLEQKQINEVATKEGPSKTLALLAHALRQNPENHEAAYRLLSMLSYQDVARLISQRKFGGQVRATAYSSLGPLVLTTTGQRDLWLWDYRREKALAGPLRHTGSVGAVTFTPSRRQFLVTLADGSVEVWNTTNTARCVCVLKPQSSAPIHNLKAFSQDESKIVTSSRGEGQNFPAMNQTMSLQVWDLRTGQPLTKDLRYEPASGGLGFTIINFTGDGSRVAIVESGGAQRIRTTWDMATGKLSPREPVRDMIEPEDRPWVGASTSSYYDPSEQNLDRGVTALETLHGTRKLLLPLTIIKETTKYGAEVELISVSGENLRDDGGELLTLSKDGTVSLWDTGPHSVIPLRVPLSRESSVNRYSSRGETKAELSGDGQRLLAIDQRATARVWDTATGKVLVESLAEPGTVTYARLGPGGQTAVTVQTNGWMRVWRLADGKPLTAAFRDGPAERAGKETDHFEDLSFSGDGTRLAAAWRSGAAQAWDLVNGKLLMEVQAHRGAAIRVILSRDGKRMATVGQDKAARIWDASTGAALAPPIKHDAVITSCQFSPDGTQLATASEDKTARIWSSQSGQAMGPPLRHEAEVSSVQFTPEGGLLVTISKDGTVRFWEPKNGSAVKAIKSGGSHVVLSHDGRFLVVSDDELGVRLWDVATASPLSGRMCLNLTTTTSGYYSLETSHFSLSADGQRLSVDTGDDVRILDFPRISGPVPDWLPRLAEIIAGQRITELGTEERIAPEEFLALRPSLLAGGGDDVYHRWVKWFLADRLSATVSPFSPMTVGQFIKGCLEERSQSSLEEALLLDSENVAALASYLTLTTGGLGAEEPDEMISGLPGQTPEQRRLARRSRARHAEALANALLGPVPDSAVAWHVKALALHWLEQDEDALEALLRANPEGLGAAYWSTKGLVLEKLSRNDEAFQALSHAIEVARGKSPHATAASQYRQRSQFLRRRNRMAEAASDDCAAKGIPPRDPSARPALIDLSLNYTASLKTDNLLNAGNDVLSELPMGIHALGKTEFDIRGMVIVSGAGILSYGAPFNKRSNVSAIPVHLRCRALHFLQNAASAMVRNEGAQVGKYTVHYANQQTQEIPILFGKHVRDWFYYESLYYENQPVEATEAPMVWVGINDRARLQGSFVRLYTMSWTNPYPDLEITSIDLESGNSHITPFLIALTAEPNDPVTPAKNPAGASNKDAVLIQTLETLDQAIERSPDYFPFARAKAGLLERMNRTNDALSLLAKIVSLDEAKGTPATNDLDRTLLARSTLLRRMHRTSEAQTDWLRANHVPPRDAQTSSNLLDLTPYYNTTLADLRMAAHLNLDELPRGVQDFAGVRFDVRGWVQLASPDPSMRGSSLPEVKGIRVNQPSRRLHFLQGARGRGAEATVVGRYIVHYTGGKQQEVPIIYGENVRDCLFDPTLSEPTKTAVVAWTAQSQGDAFRLYKYDWDNPIPDSAIESIDFTAENSACSPFLIAITTE